MKSPPSPDFVGIDSEGGYSPRMKHRCPICKTPTDAAVHADFPFCSERCRLLDLGNWAAERYVIAEPVVDEDADQAPNPNETKP